MNLKDLITLAKQGYSLADIKELVQLADDKEQSETIQEEVKDTELKGAEADEPEKAQKPDSEPEGGDDVIDYKKLYEEQKTQLEKLQNDNIRKDNSGKEEDFNTVFEDIVRGFM